MSEPLDVILRSAVFALSCDLVARPSITPRDEGCLALIEQRLAPLGFSAQRLPFGTGAWDAGGQARVENTWMVRRGKLAQRAKTFVFAGHVDVVPPGDLDKWQTPPFTPTVVGDRLYGRGTADMKTAIAAFTVAVEEFLSEGSDPAHTIALLLTSDEEGPSVHGTARVCEWLEETGQRLDWCVVGEPTSVHRVGDTIKNGRRGTLSGLLVLQGTQGHVAYPHKARNAVHIGLQALATLACQTWDAGNAHFDATTFQISNVRAGFGANNIIPGRCEVQFNFRFSTEQTAEGLQRQVAQILAQSGLQTGQDYQLTWTLGGLPFLTPRGELVQALSDAVTAINGVTPELSTSGGTSDGRFIARVCPQVAELGPCNTSIHKVNEYVQLADLLPLVAMYKSLLQRLVQT